VNSLPELDTLFLVMPISYKGRTIQYTGRLHRQHEDKSEINIFEEVQLNFLKYFVRKHLFME